MENSTIFLYGKHLVENKKILSQGHAIRSWFQVIKLFQISVSTNKLRSMAIITWSTLEQAGTGVKDPFQLSTYRTGFAARPRDSHTPVWHFVRVCVSWQRRSVVLKSLTASSVAISVYYQQPSYG